MDAKLFSLKNNEKAHQILKKILSMPENNACFECGTTSPVWASVNNGIFICFACSGLHRSFGVNVSFVRSTTMDNWSNLQVQMMILGGNKVLREYLEEKGIFIDKKSVDSKYKTKECEEYREKLKQKSEEILKHNSELTFPEDNNYYESMLEEMDLNVFLKTIMRKNRDQWTDISLVLTLIELTKSFLDTKIHRGRDNKVKKR